MTCQEFTRLINEEFRLGWPLRSWGMTLEAQHQQTELGETVALVASTHGPHRDTGVPVGVHVPQVVLAQQLRHLDEHGALTIARALLVTLVLHELDESIQVSGFRAFDPHANEYPRRTVPVPPPPDELARMALGPAGADPGTEYRFRRYMEEDLSPNAAAAREKLESYLDERQRQELARSFCLDGL